MRKTKIRIMFAAITALLFIQFSYTIKYSEPYPAVRFPGFGKVPQVTGEINYASYDLLLYATERDSMVISVENLLETYPSSYFHGILNTIVSKLNPETQTPTIISQTEDQETYLLFKQWLSSRLYSMYTRYFDKLVINKYEVTRNIETPNSPESRKLLERVEIWL